MLQRVISRASIVVAKVVNGSDVATAPKRLSKRVYVEASFTANGAPTVAGSLPVTVKVQDPCIF